MACHSISMFKQTMLQKENFSRFKLTQRKASEPVNKQNGYTSMLYFCRAGVSTVHQNAKIQIVQDDPSKLHQRRKKILQVKFITQV